MFGTDKTVRSSTDDENGFTTREGPAKTITALDLSYSGSRSGLGEFDCGMAGI